MRRSFQFFALFASSMALFSCAKTATYEHRIDTYNAAAQEAYNACFATLEPTERGSYMSLHADGRCSYSQQTTGANGKTCSANYRRKSSALAREKYSCEPDHIVTDSNGRLMIEERYNGTRMDRYTVPSRDLTDTEIWSADFVCEQENASMTALDVVMVPYVAKPAPQSSLSRREPTIGWRLLKTNGQKVELGHLRTNRSVQKCSIKWRYPNIRPSQWSRVIDQAQLNSKNAATTNP